MATMTLTDYGESIMPLALRGLEAKTLDPYTADAVVGRALDPALEVLDAARFAEGRLLPEPAIV